MRVDRERERGLILIFRSLQLLFMDFFSYTLLVVHRFMLQKIVRFYSIKHVSTDVCDYIVHKIIHLKVMGEYFSIFQHLI